MTTDPVTVLYDGRCNLCIASRQYLQAIDSQKVLMFVDIHDAQRIERLGLKPAALAGQMHLLTEAGTLLGGYDAVAAMLERLPSMALAAAWMNTWPLRSVGPVVYRWIARNRYRLFGQSICGEVCRV